VKKVAVLPTLLTLGNGICGLVAIAYASKIMPPHTLAAENDLNFAWAGWFILFAMVFDMLDGYVARLSKSASDFGGELDSLCDVVSFGVTPAFLLLKLGPGWDNPPMHQLLAGIAALYFACTALRLARFNVENNPDASSHKRFRGLPSPGAAGCIAALAIMRGEFPASLASWRFTAIPIATAQTMTEQAVEILAPFGALMAALLMVSNVAYPHVTSKIFRGRRHVGHVIQVLLVGFILVMFHSLAPLLVFWGYAFYFPLRWLLLRSLRAEPGSDSPPIDEHVPHKL
jgi:CDP-diacylglycerol---serine O-phosphatidyltransferase